MIRNATFAAFSPDGSRIDRVLGQTGRTGDGSDLERPRGTGQFRRLQPRRVAHRHRVFGQDRAGLGRRDRPAIAVLSGHEGSVNSAAFSPDGSRIVTALGQDRAGLGRRHRHGDRDLKRPRGPVNSAAFSPDGSRIVTASCDNTARVWDAATGNAIATLSGHEGSGQFRRLQPRRVAHRHRVLDKTARVWDAATGARSRPQRPRGPVNSAAFSPDGSRIVTASFDKTARVWDVSAIPKGNILQVACVLLKLHEDP